MRLWNTWNRLWQHLGRNPQRRSRPKHKARLELERLEERRVLTAPWTLITNPLPAPDAADPPDTADVMLLLPNGSVMVHGHDGARSTSADWYELTPDITGNYANGTWKVLPPMNVARFDFSSDVLPDGRVFVLGGEYSGPDGGMNETNTGEIFDPLANGGLGKWTSITPFEDPIFESAGLPSTFGDLPTEVLNNGTILCAADGTKFTFLYNPAKDPLLNPLVPATSNPWSTTGQLLYSGSNSEETWLKLPDGSILSYDIGITHPNGTFAAERYIPSTGQWVDAGQVPVPLSSGATDNEIGPALLLPDGDAFWLGSTGNTAYYHPATNTWTAGPPIPSGLSASDNPAAMMPNGEVLFAASPPPFLGQGNNFVYPGPTTIFSYEPTDPTESGFTNVTDTSFLPPTDVNLASYETKMLVLPSGQIMLSDSSGHIDLYNNGTFGSLLEPPNYSNPAWQPVITKIANDGGGTYTLTGTQLNGLSEGANFGDDAEMASNYPIIELTGGFGNVAFAQTFDWSSTGVATGSTPESTLLTLPAGFTVGVSHLSVIANGIPSKSVLLVAMGVGANELTLRVDPANSSNLQVLQAGSLLAEYPFSGFPGGIMVAGEPGPNSLTLDLSNGNPIPAAGISYDGGGGDSEILVTGSSALTCALGDTSLSVTSAGRLFGTVSLSRVVQAVLTGGPSGNNFTISGWSGLAQVNGEGGANTLSVTAPAGANVSVTGSAVTFGGTSIGYADIQSLTVGAGGGGDETFTLSPSEQNLNELPATVTINGGGTSTAVFDDQNNPATLPTTWSVSGSSVARSYNTIAVVNGRVVETPTTVTVNYSGLSALTLNSKADSMFTLSPGAHNLNELPATVTLNGGGASAAVLDDQNNAPGFASGWSVSGGTVTRRNLFTTCTINYSGLSALTLNGGPLSEFSLSPVLENLDELPPTLTITGGAASAAVLNDQNDQPAIGATWTVNSTNVSRSSSSGVVIFSGLSGLTLNTDSRGDVVNVNITHTSGYNLTIHGGSGINTLNLDEVLGDRGGPFNPNPAPQGSGTVTADYAAPGLVSTFTYTNMEIVNQLPNPDKSFVQALYHTALGRDATQAELDQWAAQIPTLGREGVARAINHLPEAYDHVITVDYQTYLHEPPPAADEARLEQLFERGATEEEVLADILGSDAFFQQATQGQDDEHESADVRYIETLFQDLLGYGEDQLSKRELHHWLRELDEVGRNGVALELLTSEPYRTQAITAYFTTILHDTQPPSAAEVDKLADSGKDLLAIQIELEGSPAFYRNGG